MYCVIRVASSQAYHIISVLLYPREWLGRLTACPTMCNVVCTLGDQWVLGKDTPRGIEAPFLVVSHTVHLRNFLVTHCLWEWTHSRISTLWEHLCRMCSSGIFEVCWSKAGDKFAPVWCYDRKFIFSCIWHAAQKFSCNYARYSCNYAR